MIHLTGDEDKAKIIADEKNLLAALCTYRAALCLPHN
jgi:hypothetical protein